jgi:xanthine dehydrogenase iron-sulfur cluster and FAD-binding subunit A
MFSRESGPETKKRIALTVNGMKVECDIVTRMTLAEFLREELDLTGTKVSPSEDDLEVLVSFPFFAT